MKIRYRIILYFGLLMLLMFVFAVAITAFFNRFTLNKLLYSNIYDMNYSVVISLESLTRAEMLERLDLIHQVTSTEIIVLNGEEIVFSSFSGTRPDLDTAYLVSEQYDVYVVRHEEQDFYFTTAFLEESFYQVYVFRGEDLALSNQTQIYYMGFIGVIFLIVSISVVSFFSARAFANPIRKLVEYANSLSPDSPSLSRPIFPIQEYNDLGLALEKAASRIHEYNTREKEFLHNFSHEMKTPLTNIFGYAEAIHYKVLSAEESQNATQIIMNESVKLRDNINQILLLGRLDAFSPNIQFRRVNLGDLLSDAVEGVAIQAKEKNIAFVISDISDSLYVHGDPEKLEVAFSNVLANAIRYAKTTIAIDALVTKTSIEVYVDDDGIGIPLEEREKIFDRFYIGFGGHTGLGLTITKAIVERHFATIIATDNPLGGARFVFSFPRRIPINSTK